VRPDRSGDVVATDNEPTRIHPDPRSEVDAVTLPTPSTNDMNRPCNSGGSIPPSSTKYALTWSFCRESGDGRRIPPSESDTVDQGKCAEADGGIWENQPPSAIQRPRSTRSKDTRIWAVGVRAAKGWTTTRLGKCDGMSRPRRDISDASARSLCSACSVMASLCSPDSTECGAVVGRRPWRRGTRIARPRRSERAEQQTHPRVAGDVTTGTGCR